MGNKCPNCGYEYGINDAFCAMCGTKLPDSDENQEIESSDKSDVQKDIFKHIKFFTDLSDKNNKKENKANFKSSIFNNPVFSFVSIMILISLIMSASLYLVIQKQNSKKLLMRYNNIISNPALIPELKEPKSFFDLKSNLKSCENFLSLYLANSNDSPEKKEQVFISYLKEMDKLPHITNENMVQDDLDECSNITTSIKAQQCAKRFTRDFSDVGISAFSDNTTIYLYPNYKFINKKYSKHLSQAMSEYLRLKARYSTPVRVGLELKLKPKQIADKIFDFELLYSKISDVYIREEVLKTIYNDFRSFIFTPSIYATTTQEMTPEFKNAYNYFIQKRKSSQLRPVIMGYMNKMRSYTEENFKNDYPYTIYEESFDENVENSSLSDIFVQLRKNIFANNSQIVFNYVYNLASASWKKFEKGSSLMQGEYVLSAPDSNNNIYIYNNTFSLIQELNVPKYSKLFISNGSLYSFNADRLNLSKVTFNGRSFALQQLNVTDASSIFPGIQVINIDSYQNYNIYVEKDNLKAGYIILSRYSQGFDGYKITPIKGNVTLQGLPNMFSVSSYDDVEISYHSSSINPKETSDSTPTFRIVIHTRGYDNSANQVINYDEKTALDANEEKYQPTIMPKIPPKEQKIIIEDIDENNLPQAPAQNIDPPSGD